MIMGDPRTFAVESEMSRAYERASFRGLGFFVIHLGATVYGVRSAEATFLACSFDEVNKRLLCRGTHDAFFSTEPDAGRVADAIGLAIYGQEEEREEFFGVSRAEFRELLHLNDIVWAPDGDQAFDDGSCVVQFDVAERVRLIGFKRMENNHHDPSSLRDIWLRADSFYEILDRWRIAFEAEWAGAPKVAEQ